MYYITSEYHSITLLKYYSTILYYKAYSITVDLIVLEYYDI